VTYRPTSVEDLLDIEAIKQLKAQYCLRLDLKRWDEWRELFADDLVVGGVPFPADLGADGFVEGVSRMLANTLSVHQVHNGCVVITGDGVARGLWAMADDLEDLDEPPGGEKRRRAGYGYYEEEYRKVDGAWRIAFLRLTRLRYDHVDWSPRPITGGAVPMGPAWLDGA
jgi:hypothetical protein